MTFMLPQKYSLVGSDVITQRNCSVIVYLKGMFLDLIGAVHCQNVWVLVSHFIPRLLSRVGIMGPGLLSLRPDLLGVVAAMSLHG